MVHPVLCVVHRGSKIVHHFVSGSTAALFSVHTKADVRRCLFLSSMKGI